ncbi:hypothetical protein ABT237_34475 [Streptomyces sp. NPDC001581]|uniref:hypothetical protein n=1 Tax=Streptomyces sp. NPDC001581 TaxID=3154386 RepID=UPI003321D571
MTINESTGRPVRTASEQILKAGSEVRSRADLMKYLEDLSTAASAIQHGLRSAAWLGLLSSEGTSPERPVAKEIDEQLTSRAAIDAGRTLDDV